MANLRDIAWLRKGCEKWNDRRSRYPDWQPDLSCVDISKCLEKKGRVTDSEKPNLRCYDLSNCNLKDSSLSGADLSGADLSGADLTNCKLWKAQIPSKGVPTLPSPIFSAKDKKIKNIADLLKYVEKLDTHYRKSAGSEPPLFYYRGESEEYTHLTPSVMRANKKCEYRYRRKESELLVELMTRRPEEFSQDQTALGKLMIAQHHRLPTRLLDVTRNPLVALYNATDKVKKSDAVSYGQLHVLVVPRPMVKPYTSHTVSVIANFTKLKRGEQNLLLTKTEEYTKSQSDCPPSSSQAPLRQGPYRSAMARLVQFVKLEHSAFEDRIDPFDLFRVFIVEPQQSIERIRAQSGAFLISAFHERFNEDDVRKVNCSVPIYHQYTFKIPLGLKCCIRKQLDTVNVTEETMYPGLEKAAKAVKCQYGR